MSDNIKIDKDNIPILFVVRKSFYLEVAKNNKHGDSVLGRWVSNKPFDYADSVRAGNMLVYSHIFNGNISFIEYSASGKTIGVPGIFVEELEELVNQDILEIL